MFLLFLLFSGSSSLSLEHSLSLSLEQLPSVLSLPFFPSQLRHPLFLPLACIIIAILASQHLSSVALAPSGDHASFTPSSSSCPNHSGAARLTALKALILASLIR